MKKVALALFIAIISLIFIACSGSSGGEADKDINQIGENYINDFLNRNFDNMVSNYDYDEEMKKVISNDFLNTTYDALISQTGDVKSRGEVTKRSQSGYEIVYEKISFENMELIINVVFNTGNQIAGFSIAPANE